jgi:hypothetical protein
MAFPAEGDNAGVLIRFCTARKIAQQPKRKHYLENEFCGHNFSFVIRFF